MFLLVSWHWTGVLLLQINASNDFIELEKYSLKFFATSVFDENFSNPDIVTCTTNCYSYIGLQCYEYT